jgi:hypothetical protein
MERERTGSGLGVVFGVSHDCDCRTEDCNFEVVGVIVGVSWSSNARVGSLS